MPEEFNFEKLDAEMFPGPFTQKQALTLVFSINNLVTALNHHNKAINNLRDAGDSMNEHVKSTSKTLENVANSLMGSIDAVSAHVVDLEKRITKLEYLT